MKLLLTILLSLSCLSGDEYTLVRSFPVKRSSFYTSDNLGNSYLISNNILYKYDSLGKISLTYTDIASGKLNFADVSNPLKLILLYPDLGKLKILDSKLTIKAEINLREVNILQPRVACLSFNDGIWIFDQQDFKLKKIDVTLRQDNESANLNQLLNIPISPDYLLEYNKQLFLNNPSSGILMFDIYGTYFKTVPIKVSGGAFQVNGDEILYLSKDSNNVNSLKSYNLKSNMEREILLPPSALDTSTVSIRIVQRKLYLFKKEIIDLYSF